MAEPTVRAEQMTQLVLGETASVLEARAEWRRVRTTADAYEGWVHRGYLRELGGPEADAWLAAATAWSEEAEVDVEGTPLRLPLRARVAHNSGAERDTVRLPDGRRGRVVRGSVRPLAEIAAEARTMPAEEWAWRRFPGTPYQWGGVTPWGVDCSGLVQTTFAARGIALPRDSSQQVAVGEPVPLEAICPGDLLYFRSESGRDLITHVAFAAANDTLIHATLACGGVVHEPWGEGTRAASLRERLVAARRLPR
ncbi:MAG TPA: C40 family peptidase [Gemmatimonadales bacterium]|nr:C40 family peptidase [Gemmatimonadales bacterium]